MSAMNISNDDVATIVMPEQTLSEQRQSRMSNIRRWVLLGVFCLAMFLDTFNFSALLAAIDALQTRFDLDESQATWVVSAFQLTYASFLLVSGRISDVYHPKPCFVGGLICLALFSMGDSLVQDKVGFIVLRALCGICAAFTIPSALSLIIRFFPEAGEQEIALALFGSTGATGVVLGPIISALFVEYTSYHCVFYFAVGLAAAAGIAGFILIPSQEPSEDDRRPSLQKMKHLDPVGVCLLTVALVLLIFAVTSGSDRGWGTGYVLAPLIISIFMLVAFFIWEARIPAKQAVVPSQTWFFPNFSVLFAISLLPYFWWGGIMIIDFELWEEVFGWSVIKSAVHLVPLGVAGLIMSATPSITGKIPRKWQILFGLLLMAIGTVLAMFQDTPDKYWRFGFTSLTIGSAGTMLVFMHANIAIFATAPPDMAGIVGAIFNSGIELGAAVGIAVSTSIESSVEKTHGGFTEFHGRRGAYGWMLAVVGLEAIAVMVFYRIDVKLPVAGSEETIVSQPHGKTRSEAVMSGK